MNKQEIEKAISLLKSDIGVLDNYLKKHPYLEEDRCVENQLIKDMKFTISALKHQLTNGWIPCKERLPANEERVLICADRKFQDGNTIQIIAVAMYEDGTMYTNESGFMWEDIDFEYDEEADDCIIPEGWWEQTMYCEEFSKVDDFVTHWMPLPEPYNEDDGLQS